jgi:hypothetical protein
MRLQAFATVQLSPSFLCDVTKWCRLVFGYQHYGGAYVRLLQGSDSFGPLDLRKDVTDTLLLSVSVTSEGGTSRLS